MVRFTEQYIHIDGIDVGYVDVKKDSLRFMQQIVELCELQAVFFIPVGGYKYL